MSAPKEICPTHLIDDEPTRCDAFTSDEIVGPHDRVARSISSLVREEAGGKIIGLEGSWGSGKSSVVNLVVDNLSKDIEYQVVTFDAWAHEGDPLRRTFLETLIQQLKSAGWIAHKHWDAVLDVLANRKRTITTRNFQKPTTFGVLFAFSLLLVPVGTVLLEDALQEYGISFHGNEVAWEFIFGLSMCLAPFLTSVGNAIRLLFRGSDQNNEKTSQAEAWALLNGKFEAETKTETTETPNPTSLEFERYFRELMDGALRKFPSRRVLLVVDNLDRADIEVALNIWSTLQIFMQDPKIRQLPWFSQVWILVPFDPAGLSKLWEGNSGRLSPTVSDTDGLTLASRVSTERSSVAESFFEKSFQVRFQVPPLVLSGWRQLLLDLLAKAFPKHQQNELHQVFRVIDLFRTDLSTAPTPRQLKAFINQIGTLHRQWQHEFPLEHLAYFALHSRDRAQLVIQLRNSTHPTQEAIRILGDQLRENLAGLVFNVSAKMGTELLLSDLILKELREPSQEDSINELANEHGAGFWTTLEHVADARFRDMAPSDLGRVACSMHHSTLLQSSTPLERTHVLRALASAAARIDEWTPLDGEIGRGMAAAMQLCADTNLSARMFTALQTTLGSYASNASNAVQTGRKFVAAAMQLLSAAKTLGQDSIIPTQIQLPVSPSEWCDACLELSESGAELWRTHFRPSCGLPAVQTYLETEINAGRFSGTSMAAIEVTSTACAPVDWISLVTPIRMRLDAGTNIPSSEARTLLLALAGWQSAGKLQRRTYREILEHGHLLHHYLRAVQDANNEARALFAYLLLLENPANSRVGGTAGNSEAGYQELELAFGRPDSEFAVAFVDVLRKNQRLPLLLSILDARARRDPFIVQCLKLVASSECPGELFSSKEFRKRWEVLKQILSSNNEGELFQNLLKKLLAQQKLGDALMSDENGFQVAEAPFYSEIASLSSDEHAAKVAKWCGMCLEGIPTQAWNTDFTTTFSLASLAITLNSSGSTPSLSIAFADAVERHAIDVASGSNYPPESIAKSWSLLLSSIADKSSHAALRGRILRMAADQSIATINDKFFELYAGELEDVLLTSSFQESALRLFHGLVKQRSPITGLVWMLRVLVRSPLSVVSQEYQFMVADLKTRISQSLVGASEDAAQEALLQLKHQIENS